LLGKREAEVDSKEESPQSSSTWCLGSIDDRIEEDFSRSERAQATGFMGKNSEIRWMQRLWREADKSSHMQDSDHANGSNNILFHEASESGIGSPPLPLSDVREDFSIASANYYLDDLGISVPGTVEPYEIPPRKIANKLFDAYLALVHPSFPIIGKVVFTSQYRSFFDQPSRKPGHKWLAILNMIFAIAAKYSHLVQADWRADDRDHLIYFTRARKLSMNGDALFSHPDLQQVQVEGLVAFYFLATGQINRYAWRLILSFFLYRSRSHFGPLSLLRVYSVLAPSK